MEMRDKDRCEAWCATSIVARSILPPRYHTVAEICSWAACDACEWCLVEDASRAVRAHTSRRWKTVNLHGPNLARVDFLDHRACLKRCKGTRGCAGVVWNCDATCYLKRAPHSDGSQQPCTFSHVLSSQATPCLAYAAALPEGTSSIDLPPTVCCPSPYSPPTPDVSPPLVASTRVLLVTPVGYRARDNVRARCRTIGALRQVDFYAAHYDASAAWYARQPWFRGCAVAASTLSDRVKGSIVKKLLARHRTHWYSLYSHIWLVDDDIVFPPTAYVARFLSQATERGFLISQPAIFGSMHSDVKPRDGCTIAQTEFVEIMASLVRLDVLERVLHVFLSPNATSDWGIDQLWCKYAANLYPAAAACGVVTSGVFRHAVSSPAARSTYSHSDARRDQACLRAAHPSLAPTRAPLCLQTDAFYGAEPALLEASEANQFWSAPRRQLSMYVYDLERVNAHFCVTRKQATRNFEWEMQIVDALSRVFPRTENPAQADFFVVPACLTTVWANSWTYRNRRRVNKLTSNVSETRTYERLVLEEVRRVGDFYDTHPDRHLMARHKCPLVEEGWWENGAGLVPYAHLWNSSVVRYVCIETDVQNLHRRDVHREVHVPYFTDSRTAQEVTPLRMRRHRFGYSGSLCCGRSWLRWMMPNDSVLLLTSHMGHGYRERSVSRFLHTCMYAVQPHGDTPERRSIYEALHAGTPNLFLRAVPPPLRYGDWGELAYTLPKSEVTRIDDGTLRLRLRTYDSRIARIAAERQRFLWHSRDFLDRLYLILCDVFRDDPST